MNLASNNEDGKKLRLQNLEPLENTKKKLLPVLREKPLKVI